MRGSAAAHLLEWWVWIPPWALMFSCECCVCQVEVSATRWSRVRGRHADCGVSECDREASMMRRCRLTTHYCAMEKKRKLLHNITTSGDRTQFFGFSALSALWFDFFPFLHSCIKRPIIYLLRTRYVHYVCKTSSQSWHAFREKI
jgi:hypothetical protein